MRRGYTFETIDVLCHFVGLIIISHSAFADETYLFFLSFPTSKNVSFSHNFLQQNLAMLNTDFILCRPRVKQQIVDNENASYTV